MERVLKKYQISPELSCDEQLALLEKEKQKLLRKLNHVFGNPGKEAELNEEMELLEQAMEVLIEDGGSLSPDDVNLVDMIVYYLRNQIYDKYGYWCQYGAQLGISYFMKLMYEYHTMEMFGAQNPQKAFYWLKKAAEAGEKDCCLELGKRYLDQKSELFHPQMAAVWFVKAADEEHPDAYLRAFTAFYVMGDQEKAEICLKAACDMEVPGAAYRMALIYDTDDNQTGERQIGIAKYWYEQAYIQEADGDICYGLGSIYEELGETDLAQKLYLQGAEEFDSEDCRECLESM